MTLLPLKEKPLNSTTMRSQEHCIADRMMESSSAACHIKRHRKTLEEAHDGMCGADKLGPKLGD